MRIFDVFVLIVCVGIVAGAYVLSVEIVSGPVFGLSWLMRCFIYHNFHIKCALCGLTRSVCALAAGNIAAAIHYHHLGPAVFAFIIGQIPYRIWALAKGTPKKLKKARKANAILAALLAAAILIDWMIYLWGRLL